VLMAISQAFLLFNSMGDVMDKDHKLPAGF
jgi:hypothetical protein